MNDRANEQPLVRRFFFGAAWKAYVAFKEGRLAMSPAAWVRLLRLHYEELRTPSAFPPKPPESPGAPPVVTTALPGMGVNTSTAPQPSSLDRVVLQEFLAGGERLRFRVAAQPLVSVLVVLHNRAELTLRCLRALRATDLSIDVVLVDNASTDLTSRLLDRLDGVTLVTNPINLGFLAGVNQGAARARGELLLLLNSDAEVLPGSLEAAVDTFQSSGTIGAVVGKLVHLDGRLQEAGSIVWQDGSCQGYGRGDDPLSAPYMFRRPVDFGSGAFLLTRRSTFTEAGGFDERFKPAYYEDADYCLRLWRSGRQVIYEPRAVVLHVEFASSTSSDAAVEMQAERRALFVHKHGAWLRAHAKPPGTSLLLARSRVPSARRLLLVEDRVPHEKLGAGYPRSRAIVGAALALGYEVTLYPLLEASEPWEEAYSDMPREVELVLGEGQAGLAGFLRKRVPGYDAMIVSRPHNMREVSQVLQDVSRADLPVLIYDVEAVFALREIGRRRLAGIPASAEETSRMVNEELSLARGCDVILTVSRAEADRFSQAGFSRVEVMGNSAVPRPTRTGFDGRLGFLFVGAFVDEGTPNTDSVVWFVRQVLPLIRAKLGASVPVTVAGRNGSSRVAALSDHSVVTLGLVEDLAPLYDRARIFVAPTRFGAGIPLKAHQAAAFGVPIVCTSLVAEQLGWDDGQTVLVADDARGFAEQCCRLYQDPDLWTRLRDSALRRVERDCSPHLFRQSLAHALESAVAVREVTGLRQGSGRKEK